MKRYLGHGGEALGLDVRVIMRQKGVVQLADEAVRAREGVHVEVFRQDQPQVVRPDLPSSTR